MLTNHATEPEVVTPAELAFAWAETRIQTEEDSEVDDLVTSFEAFGSDEASDDAERLVAPSWMLAAVAKMDGSAEPDMGLQE